MSLRLKVARHARRIALVSLCFALMTGCQSFTATSSTARLRVVDLSQDAGTLDIYEANHAIAYNLVYGAVTSYVPLLPGTYVTAVAPAGLRQTLSSLKSPLLSGKRYTLLINSPVAGLRQTLLVDEPPASGPSMRLIHQADGMGAVDVYLVPAGQRLAATVPLVTNLAPDAITAYLSIPEGVSTVMILPAGTHPSNRFSAVYTGRHVEDTHGSARTLILLDAAPTVTRRLDVVETVEADATNQ